MARPKSKTKKILFAVEIIVLLLFIGGLYVYGQLNSKLDKINQPVLDDSKIKVNQEVQDSIDSQESTLTGYTTYALFGIDHRDKNTALGGENSDTIIIASVNNDTKDVKLVSVYRDTLLNLGNDTYSKANAAYAYGEAEQAITMLNTNLDLNISEYATVNFNALTTIIDDLGGLDMDMSYAEIVHMNNYCVETSEETGKDYTPIELPDRPDDIEAVQYHYHLNGVQATSYCRIRYTASLDMGRTERQRRVIQMIVSKAKSAGLGKIFKIMDDVFPMVTTSMTKDDLPVYGIKTFFCSNVCAAYKRDIYQKLGGFVRKAIFNEDMIYAGRLIQEGYAVAYAADAKVIHSHNYSCMQQFHRNFDLGVSQAEHPEIFAGVPSEGEGIKLVKKTINYLIQKRKIWLIPGVILQSGCKYAGYLSGKNYRKLPRKMILWCTMNREYWKV